MNIPSPAREAAALRIVADILDERSSSAQVAEIAAPVPGEVGRGEVIDVDDPSGGRTIMVRFSDDEWCGPRDLTSDLDGVMAGNPSPVIV